jgi:hypothetical protein
MGLDTKTDWLTDWPTDRPTVSRNVTLTLTNQGSDRVTEFSVRAVWKIVVVEAREQSELGLGVQKSTGAQTVKILMCDLKTLCVL